MENESNQRRFESVYSQKVRAGKRRTYFFDVRQTKGDDFYVTLTESTRRFNSDGYERHKIFLYKEDFNRFMAALNDVVDHVKTELMPDYDYEEYTRRHAEWEKERAARALEEEANPQVATETAAPETSTETVEKVVEVEAKTETAEEAEAEEEVEVEEEIEDKEVESEDDMSW